MVKTYHYVVKGRVQGVSFRYYTRKAALELGITGTVRNLYTGDVEVYAQGESYAIKRFEEFLHSGPLYAHIIEVITEEIENSHVYPDFEIIF